MHQRVLQRDLVHIESMCLWAALRKKSAIFDATQLHNQSGQCARTDVPNSTRVQRTLNRLGWPRGAKMVTACLFAVEHPNKMR